MITWKKSGNSCPSLYIDAFGEATIYQLGQVGKNGGISYLCKVFKGLIAVMAV